MYLTDLEKCFADLINTNIIPFLAMTVKAMKEDEEFPRTYNKGFLEQPILWFTSFTSVGGLTQIRSSRGSISEKAWIVLFLIGVVGTSYNVFQVMCTYFAYGVNTSITLNYEDNQEFPSVTICNSNRINCDTLSLIIEQCEQNQAGCKDPTRLELYCQLFAISNCDLTNQVAKKFWKPDYNHTKICRSINTTLLEQYNNIPECLQEVKFNALYLKLSAKEGLRLAHHPKQFIRYCAFNNQMYSAQCDILTSGIRTVFSPTLGYCYAFNLFDGESEEPFKPVKQLLTGPNYGLTLILDIGTPYYMRNGLTPKEGVLVTVDNPNTPPNIDGAGIAISASTSTRIAMRKKVMHREKAPYTSNCTNEFPYKVKKVVGYHVRNCKNTYLNQLIYETCGCIDSFTASLHRINVYQDTKVCQFGNATWYYCPNKINLESLEACQLGCTEVTYETKVSQMKYPSDKDWVKVATAINVTSNYNESLPELVNMIELHYDPDNKTMVELKADFDKMKFTIQNNFLEVKVFFESFSTVEISETPEYTFTSFLSALGGAVSFYLGLSLVTMCEFVELLFRIVREGIYKV